MERRQLLAASSAVLAWGPLSRLHAQSLAQAAGTAATPASTSSAAADKPFTAAQLDQMLAPIALYPDGLLAQMMMAASYPLEVVEAARWVQANPNLKGDAAVNAAKRQGWDASVTSLVAFPQVLAMMNSKLDWTQKLGDAMLAQQSDVAASIQRLRAQAKSAGNLKTTPQQKVTTQALTADAPAGTPPPIVIEPANPQVIYVPYYDPNYIYGTWPYAAYPPTYFPPPPGAAYATGLMTGLIFGAAIGMAAGGFFGGWAWHGGWGGGWGWGGWGHWGNTNYVTVNNNVTNYDHDYFHNHNNDGNWHFNPDHRHGVPYRDPVTREKYGQRHPTPAQDQAFRGRLENSPHPAAQGAGRTPTTAPRANETQRNEAQRSEANRSNQDRGYENRSDAFSGVDHGSEVNREASRGYSYGDHSGWDSHRSYYGGGYDRGGGWGYRGGGGGHWGRR